MSRAFSSYPLVSRPCGTCFIAAGVREVKGKDVCSRCFRDPDVERKTNAGKVEMIRRWAADAAGYLPENFRGDLMPLFDKVGACSDIPQMGVLLLDIAREVKKRARKAGPLNSRDFEFIFEKLRCAGASAGEKGVVAILQ